MTYDCALHPQGGQDSRHGDGLPEHPAVQHHLKTGLPAGDGGPSVYLPTGLCCAPDHRGVSAYCAFLVSPLVHEPKERRLLDKREAGGACASSVG